VTPQTDPSPEQRDALTAGLPTFLPPQESPRSRRRALIQSPSPSSTEPAPSSTSDPDDFDASPSEDETPETLTGSPSPASTKPPRPLRLDAGVRKGYEQTAKQVAKAASTVIDTQLGAQTGAFLIADDEAQNIAEPASRLAARHIPLPGGGGQATDLADAVELIVAVFGYVMNSLHRRQLAFAGHTLTGTADPLPVAADEGWPEQDDAPPPAPTPAWPAPGGNLPPMVGSGSL